MRIWAATRRRERTLEQPATVFEAAVPARIRADERFQVALEDAETAESLERAMALHQANMRDWAAKGYTLLRAVEAADDAYERDVSKAFDVFRNSVRGNEEASDGG